VTQAELFQMADRIRYMRDEHIRKAAEHSQWVELMDETIKYLEGRAAALETGDSRG
jgi:hypothetical protein